MVVAGLLNVVVGIALLLLVIWAIFSAVRSLESIAESLRRIAGSGPTSTIFPKDEV